MRASPSRLPPRPSPKAAFTMAEMLVVMAIITILAASLAVVVPRLRAAAMADRAAADIQAISYALGLYENDNRGYPTAPFWRLTNPGAATSSWTYACTKLLADDVLYQALTNPDYNGTNQGWSGASTEWKFIREGNINLHSFSLPHQGSFNNRYQILDPWGVPYYYIAHPDYIVGVRIGDENDSTSDQGSDAYGNTCPQPNCYGTTETPDDFRSPSDHDNPPNEYRGPPPKQEEFYNPTTFQIHSKGPDQATDIDDGDEDHIDACDRGTDGDDIHNFGTN